MKAPQTPFMCFPRAQHVTANSLCLLKQYEDTFGGAPYKHCTSPDWSTFPGLDPLAASVLEWGHSMDDDLWAVTPSGRQEFEVSVSEWVLNSTSASYLLNDRDYDSHTPLLIEVQHQSSGSQRPPEPAQPPSGHGKGGKGGKSSKGKETAKGKSKDKSKGKGTWKN